MATAFFTILGASLLLLIISDIYMTILQARGRSGPISESFYRSIWRMTRGIAFRLPRQRRHRLLNFVGPVLMPTLVIILITLLILGFALIYFPRMPAEFAVGAEDESSPWMKSIYFSGKTLTTVGYGDITPRSAGMRVVALIEASSGLGLITLAVTYLVVVYRALERKRAIALSFYHKAEGGADVVEFIRHHFVAGHLSGIAATLRIASHDLQEMLESHIEHPIIHYFHPVEVYKGLPRVLFLSLEICAVIKACLDQDEYAELSDHPEVLTMQSSALHALGEFISLLDLKGRARRPLESDLEESDRWRKRFEQTIHHLNEAGIKTEPDEAKGWEIYRAQRDEWEGRLYQLARHLGYDWDEVTGDRDLEYAADEGMVEIRQK